MVGKVEVEVPGYGISGYSWLKGSDRYAYYNVELRMKKDDIPDGYEVYRVRAWRQVKLELLDEPLEQFADRKVAKYLFEDIDGTEYQPGHNTVIGDELIENVQDNSGNTIPVYRGTFGARKVRTSTPNVPNDGCIDKLDMKFIVRLYFAPKRVVEEQDGQLAPRLKAEGDTDDRPFYIAEYVYPFTINGGIPTGIETLTARQVVSEKYYNPAGIESSTPFQGVNIVVTRYSDGSTTTTKILR